ncbi:MAG: cytochrome c family protein [Chloroflexi bacterium]|nr:cytochrome c family protein [Chloroflexota bacterium]
MTKRLLLTLISGLILAAVTLTACGPKAPPPPTPTPTPAGDAVAGQKNFATTCASCHGPDGKGMPNLGKDLTISEFVSSKTDTELVAFLLVGRPASDPLNTVGVDMPPKGGNPVLTDKDLLDIIAYVRSIHQ